VRQFENLITRSPPRHNMVHCGTKGRAVVAAGGHPQLMRHRAGIASSSCAHADGTQGPAVQTSIDVPGRGRPWLTCPHDCARTSAIALATPWDSARSGHCGGFPDRSSTLRLLRCCSIRQIRRTGADRIDSAMKGRVIPSASAGVLPPLIDRSRPFCAEVRFGPRTPH